MELLNLFFDFNSQLWYSILFSILFILLVFLDRMLFGLIPNFIVGSSGLVAFGSWIYYLWSTNTNIGKGIILAVIFILLALIITTEWSKKKSNITQIGSVVSPSKIGKQIKNIRR